MDTLQPVGNHVVVKLFEEEETSLGGVFIPAPWRDYQNMAQVIAVGPGVVNQKTGERMALDLAPGDEIYFQKYAGVEVTIGDEQCYVLRENEILAKRV